MPKKRKLPFTGKEKKDPAKRIVKKKAYYDSEGKRRVKTFTAYSEDELALKITEWNNDRVKNQNGSMTVLDALNRYVEFKTPVLSPSSVRSYKRVIAGRISDHEISAIPVDDLTMIDMQRFINWEITEGLSAKTVKDHYCLIKSAVNLQRKVDFDVVLPQQEKHIGYTPSDAEIKKLMEYTKEKDHELYVCILLCAFGPLRRSEACCITSDDIHGNLITINKALVRDEFGAWIEKPTKTTESTRVISYPDFVIKELKDYRGRIIQTNPNAIANKYRRAMQHAGLRVCGMHSLRRYGASIIHSLSVPDAYLMQRGGWKNATVMRAAYITALDDQQKKQTDVINAHFAGLEV